MSDEILPPPSPDLMRAFDNAFSEMARLLAEREDAEIMRATDLHVRPTPLLVEIVRRRERIKQNFDEWLASTAELIEECRERRQ